ncbi:MAG: hypothetical protein ACOX9E_07690 [Lentisphaeria bacterium]
MKTKGILLVAVLFTACQCMAQKVVIASSPKVFQVVDEMTVLARLTSNDMNHVCIIGLPTKELYEGAAIPKNFKKEVLLVPSGVYRYKSITGAPTQIRQLLWIHPSRISLETVTEPCFTSERCSRCNGRGRLSQRRGELGRRICTRCGGSGRISRDKTSKKTTIYIDGKPVKEEK